MLRLSQRFPSRGARHPVAGVVVSAVVAVTVAACSDDDSATEAEPEPVCDESVVAEIIEDALDEVVADDDLDHRMRNSAYTAAQRIFDLGEEDGDGPTWERRCGMPGVFLVEAVVIRYLVDGDEGVRDRFELAQVPDDVWLVAEDLTERYFAASTIEDRDEVEDLLYALRSEPHELATLYEELEGGDHPDVDRRVADAAAKIDRDAVEDFNQPLDSHGARFEMRWISLSESPSSS